MDYNELYDVWRNEREKTELQFLPRDFYARLSSYTKKIIEESRMLDKKSSRFNLIQHEFENVKRLIRELVELRYVKVVRMIMTGKALSKDTLTEEEQKLKEAVQTAYNKYQTLLKNITRGHLPRIGGREKPKNMVVRFLQEIPAIIGSDMKTYGPFQTEDVASLPIENARILIEKGVVVEVTLL